MFHTPATIIAAIASDAIKARQRYHIWESAKGSTVMHGEVPAVDWHPFLATDDVFEALQREHVKAEERAAHVAQQAQVAR
jgi:hypothetical protein